MFTKKTIKSIKTHFVCIVLIIKLNSDHTYLFRLKSERMTKPDQQKKKKKFHLCMLLLDPFQLESCINYAYYIPNEYPNNVPWTLSSFVSFKKNDYCLIDSVSFSLCVFFLLYFFVNKKNMWIFFKISF